MKHHTHFVSWNQFSRNTSQKNFDEIKQLNKVSSSKNFQNRTFYNNNKSKNENNLQSKTLNKFYSQKPSTENLLQYQANDSFNCNNSLQDDAALKSFYKEKDNKQYKSRKVLANKLNEIEGNSSSMAFNWINLQSKNVTSRKDMSSNIDYTNKVSKNEEFTVSDSQFNDIDLKKNIQFNLPSNYKAKTVYVRNDPYKSDKGNYRRLKVSENDWSNLCFGKKNKVIENKKMINEFEDQLRTKKDQLNLP